LDWRWIGRFRKLSANSTTWWLTWAGPFTEEEQREWDHLFGLPFDEGIREQLGRLMKTSRERELNAALSEQRQPRLYYPAIPIERVRSEINDLLQLAEDIRTLEPNAIVRRLYLGAIEEDVDYLRLIEATYERKTKCFWQYNQRVFPLPSSEDMHDALTHIKALLRRGFTQSSTREIRLQLQEIISSRFHLASDVEQVGTATGSTPLTAPSCASQTQAEPERTENRCADSQALF